jgi:hypothetical protein
MTPKLTVEAMLRRLKQQLKYDPVLNVGASGLVYSGKEAQTKVSDDRIVYVIRKEQLRAGGIDAVYKLRLRAEAHNALAKVIEYAENLPAKPPGRIGKSRASKSAGRKKRQSK